MSRTNRKKELVELDNRVKRTLVQMLDNLVDELGNAQSSRHRAIADRSAMEVCHNLL
jgi:hypothetical protein